MSELNAHPIASRDACTVTHNPLRRNGSDGADPEEPSHRSREKWQRLTIMAALITAVTALITAVTGLVSTIANLVIWLL
ncbi:hypothetical protein OG713_27400 [Streptomyces sp. NBC_00723]|uniref:hypothetical protein n=1 Tax=Streptomyces sp. NBC_00723 TaxID=2903673 RepID=UPI003866F6A4